VKRLIKKFPDQPLTLADAHGLAITSHRRLSTCWSTNRHLGITGVTLVIKRTHQSDSIGAAREQSRRPGRSAACESGYETPRHKVKRSSSEILPRDVNRIADSAFAVHGGLGPGLIESVYEACLIHKLYLRELKTERQVTVPVCAAIFV